MIYPRENVERRAICKNCGKLVVKGAGQNAWFHGTRHGPSDCYSASKADPLDEGVLFVTDEEPEWMIDESLRTCLNCLHGEHPQQSQSKPCQICIKHPEPGEWPSWTPHGCLHIWMEDRDEENDENNLQ